MKALLEGLVWKCLMMNNSQRARNFCRWYVLAMTAQSSTLLVVACMQALVFRHTSMY
jgi:hypothetical protein